MAVSPVPIPTSRISSLGFSGSRRMASNATSMQDRAENPVVDRRETRVEAFDEILIDAGDGKLILWRRHS